MRIEALTETAGEEARPGLAAGLSVALAVFVHVALLAFAAARNLDRFNPDAVAYYEVALHLLHDRFDLAVSGYWGPLLSWLMLPPLALTGDPFVAGRIALALSSLCFLCGGTLLMARLLPGAAGIAVWVLSAFGLAWSVQIVTPDLLVSGLLLSGVALSLGEPRKRTAIAAGIAFGLAYLAKSVALPLGLALILALAIWRLARRQNRRGLLPASALSACAMLAVCAPWFLVLSLKYGQPSFGTSGAINHAAGGPPYAHPGDPLIQTQHLSFTTFHRPRAGRVTSWEEPSEMGYASWSPLASGELVRHQLRIVGESLVKCLRTLFAFDLLGLGAAAALALLAAALAVWPRVPLWQLSAVPIALNVLPYSPVLSEGEPRYLMFAYPFLLAAAFGLMTLLAPRGALRWPLRRALAFALVVAAFLAPLRHDLQHALLGRPNPHLLHAKAFGAAIEETGETGGIASVEELGFTAIFTAFLIQRPFHGTEGRLPESSRLSALGIRFLMVARGGPADQALGEQPGAIPLADLAPRSAPRLAALPVVGYVLK